MFMNCVRFVEALGVPQDGAAGVFLLLKDTLEFLNSLKPFRNKFSRHFFGCASGVSAGVRSRFDGMCLLRETRLLIMPDFWSRKGPSFARIAFPGEEILWKSAAKASPFRAKYRKQHPCIGIF